MLLIFHKNVSEITSVMVTAALNAKLTFSVHQYHIMSMSNANVTIDYNIDIHLYEIFFLFRNYIIQDTRKAQHRGIAFC